MVAERTPTRPAVDEGGCASVILSQLKGRPGVIAAGFDAENVHIHFDPNVTDQAQAEATADELVLHLSEYRRSCPGEGGAHCSTCAMRVNQMLMPTPALAGDRVMLPLAPAMAEPLAVSRPMAKPAQAKGEPEPEANEIKPLLLSTVACALFLASGYAAENWLHATPAVTLSLYALSYATGGYFRLVDGFRALVKEHNLDINFLMLLGALGAAVLGKWSEGAILMFLFTLSATLEAFAVGRTRQAIRKLMALAPEDALVRRGAAEVRVAVGDLRTGDLVIVGPGERIAADGEIVKGSSAINEAAITGESIPVEKGEGDKLFAGTVNGHGVLEFVVRESAAESTLARIIRVVEEAQSQKASTQRLTDWIDRYYTLIVISVAALAWVVPPLVGWDSWQGSFYRAMMLLVVASPCALVISTPAAILSAIARSARAGILFKGGLHLEQAALINVVALDKTGTLTSGRPGVVEIMPEAGVGEEELLSVAAAAESRSEHPLAVAVLRAANERQIAFTKAEEFQALAGLGAKAMVGGRTVYVGHPRLLAQQQIAPSAPVAERLENLLEAGLTTMAVVADGRLLGILGLADTPRPEAKQAIATLKRLGVKRVVMLTGDNRKAAQLVADAVGVDEVRAELLPEDKLSIVKELEAKYGHVAMVGDGVNDAPALAAASVGVAMGGVGSDVAMETADVVLMADELPKLAEAINLARKARAIVIQNLVFAMGVIALLVVAVLLNRLTLPLAVVGHEGSTILVAFNGLRLLVTRTQVSA